MNAQEQARFEELKAKADGPGLTAEEANELGKLYAAAENADYANAETAGDAERLTLEAEEQRVKDEVLADTQWKAMDQDRSRISFKEGPVTKG